MRIAPLVLLLALAVTSGCQSQPAVAPQPAEPVEIGVLEAMNGTSLDVDAALARGERVALVFWQTWCESCEQEAPQVAQAATDHRGQIRFVGVVPGAEGDVVESEVLATADMWGYATFPQVRDPELSLSRKLGVQGTPTILVLGKGGQVLYTGHRPPADWTKLRGAAFDPDTAGGCEGGVCPLPDAPSE